MKNYTMLTKLQLQIHSSILYQYSKDKLYNIVFGMFGCSEQIIWNYKQM
jgi:hypothetical protein